MTAKIIDGRAIAQEIRENVARDVKQHALAGRQAHLAALIVGDNPAAKMYANMQKKSSDSVGIIYELISLPDDTTTEQLLCKITLLNETPEVTGIILQLPLPEHLDTHRAQWAISPLKDVEAVHPANMGMILYGNADLAPCTPMAALTLLRSVRKDLAGAEIVVVGHSEILGKPLATLLLASKRSAPTVTICHVATKDLAAHTKKADVLFVAAGAAQGRWLAAKKHNLPTPDLSPLIKGDMIKPGAIIIDAAINRIPDNFGDGLDDNAKVKMKTVGDVDFAPACKIASAITPVPGGVGPVTVAMLLQNTIACMNKRI